MKIKFFIIGDIEVGSEGVVHQQKVVDCQVCGHLLHIHILIHPFLPLVIRKCGDSCQQVLQVGEILVLRELLL